MEELRKVVNIRNLALTKNKTQLVKKCNWIIKRIEKNDKSESLMEIIKELKYE